MDETTPEDKIFLGHFNECRENPNLQIYCAVIAYCLVAIVGNTFNVERRIYEILQIMSISLLDKTPVGEILTEYDYKNVNELKNKQLKINGF